ncbi:unnamed protein product [Arabis nemorensis]|uniref:Uncharacterized protein n=1 Tax=Arabis nemorensis TaxID=586526 RepID=A0A565BD43_9BRAS|nr:unnamed protein product [Arabis nemorensis]
MSARDLWCGCVALDGFTDNVSVSACVGHRLVWAVMLGLCDGFSSFSAVVLLGFRIGSGGINEQRVWFARILTGVAIGFVVCVLPIGVCDLGGGLVQWLRLV